MPLYEYYCKHCDGVFEAMGQIKTAPAAAACPVCARKSERMMPTSFSAFTMREGYPRAIPDRGTYYHLEKEVKMPISGSVRMNEHPEINKPRPKRKKSKGELDVIADREHAALKEKRKLLESGITPIEEPKPAFQFDED